MTSVDYESDFVVGSINDAAVQAQIAEFKGKVNAVIGDRRANLERDEKKLEFDHFESSNIIDMTGGSILVGDTEALEEAVQGGVSKNLDVHEYQRYTITQEYTVYATQIAAIRLENATLTFKAGMRLGLPAQCRRVRAIRWQDSPGSRIRRAERA